MVRWEMVQQVKAPGTKPEGLSSIPQSQSMRRESHLCKLTSGLHTCMHIHPSFPLPTCLFIFSLSSSSFPSSVWVLLCSSGWSRTHNVDLTELELPEIYQPLPRSAGTEDMLFHSWL